MNNCNELLIQYKFLQEYGNELRGIMSNPNISDNDVYAYIKCHLPNLLEKGSKRLALITAASGRLELLDLIIAQNVSWNAREPNFGYTPLHFSILHGQIHCAVRLIQRGCNTEIKDKNDLIAFDLCIDESKPNETELFIWGCNTNYTLGLSNDRKVPGPEPSDYFFKKKLTVYKVAMGKYHTVFLTQSGVYFCGLRSCVGEKTEIPTLIPCQIPFTDNAICNISVGEHHTLFLTDRFQAFSCGKNTFYGLGFSDNPSVVSKPVELFKNSSHVAPATHICAGPQHTVIVTNSSVYTCGNNLGQLGHPKESGKFVAKLTQISLKLPHDQVLQVAACLDATVFTTIKYIYILADFEREKIDIPGHFGTRLEICCSTSICKRIIAIATENNEVYVWNSSMKTFLLCVFPQVRSISTIKFNPNGCIFLTFTGRGYLGSFGKIDTDQKIQWMETERIVQINQASRVWCDPQGRNFGVLQRSLVYPKRESNDFHEQDVHNVRLDLSLLFDEACEEDTVHDIIIKLRGETIAAHSCVLFHPFIKTSMEQILKGNASQKIYTVDAEPISFSRYLRYIYNPYILKNMDIFDTAPKKKTMITACEAAAHGIDRHHGDMFLISEDKIRHSVHKCILVARMEYFKAMFSHQWQEKQLKEHQIPIPSNILSAFIDVMYTGTSAFFNNTNLDVMTMALKISDEYVYQEFKDLVEIRFKELVNFRNAPKIIPIANRYNAPAILEYVHQFIGKNLSAFLEARSLENLSDDELIALSEVYKQSVVCKIEKNCDNSLVEKVREISKQYSATLEKESKKAKTVNEAKKRRPRSSSETINSSIEEPPSPTIPEKAEEEPTEIPETIVSNSSQTVQRRLKVITENLHSSLPGDSFTLLGKSNDFPELNSSPRPIPTPKSSSDVLSKRFTRPSQRERKRLTSNSSTGDESSLDIASPPQSPWASLPPVNIASPKSEERLPKIDSIILEEKEERKRIARVVNKPLDLTLMEDQAMRDLQLFYNAAEATEERITVQRLSATVALPTPVWPPQSVARSLW